MTLEEEEILKLSHEDRVFMAKMVLDGWVFHYSQASEKGLMRRRLP